MKKIFKLSYLLLASFIFVTQVFAATATTTTTPVVAPNKDDNVQAIPIATVNIQDAKIESQSGNNFKISFFISNREGLQTGVKYGIRVYSQGQNGQLGFIAAEKVYDDSLSLAPNSRVKKIIDYTAPSVLGGEYFLSLLSYNANGFPFAFTNVGKIKLTQTAKGIEILNDSCFTKINNDSKEYKIGDLVSIKPEDKLYVGCKVLNNSSDSVSVTPLFETRLNNSFGNIVSSSGGDTTEINFKASENKEVSVLVPTQSIIPQVYSLSFSLKNDKNISNSVSFSYKIEGVSATISNISLDKNSYKRGDIAKATALIRLNNLNIDNSVPAKYYLNTTILNNKNAKCAKVLKREIDNNFLINFDVPIKSECNTPKIIASITDSNGKILSQMGDPSLKRIYDFNDFKYIIAILILIILAVILFMYLKKKKDSKKENISPVQSSVLPIIFIAIFTSLLSNMFFVNKASADTFCLTSLSTCDIQTVISLDKSSYEPSTTVTVSGYLVTNPFSPVNGHTAPSYLLTATQNSTTQTFSTPGSYSSVTFTAPSTPGSYSISTRTGIGCSAGQRIDSIDGGCASPGMTEFVNTGTVGGTRTQAFRIGDSVMPGDVFTITVYSHSISTTAVAGDTASSIMVKLRNAVDATTEAQWNDHGSAPKSGTPGFKPSTRRYNSNELGLLLNYQNQFAASGSPQAWDGMWKYSSNSLSYSVMNPPTISIASSSPSITSGSYVDITWTGNNLNNCVITKTPQSSSAVDITPGDMRTSGNIRDYPTVTTTYTANCANYHQACVGKSTSDNALCSYYSYMDESCVLDNSQICAWIGW